MLFSKCSNYQITFVPNRSKPPGQGNVPGRVPVIGGRGCRGDNGDILLFRMTFIFWWDFYWFPIQWKVRMNDSVEVISENTSWHPPRAIFPPFNLVLNVFTLNYAKKLHFFAQMINEPFWNLGAVQCYRFSNIFLGSTTCYRLCYVVLVFIGCIFYIVSFLGVVESEETRIVNFEKLKSG